MASLSASLSEAISIANSIRDAVASTYYSPPPVKSTLFLDATLNLPPPKPLTSQLTELGLPYHVAERMSDAYVQKAVELQKRTEQAVHSVCRDLAAQPRSDGCMQLEQLQQELLRLHSEKHANTLCSWAQQAEELARSRLDSLNADSSRSSQVSNCSNNLPSKKSKRPFKSEFLPLFEFAFDKDHFPSREDKMHLARISGMSFRQVTVWFQNRRRRQATRAQSNRATPAPRTFEEMKERLGESAREALSKSHPLVKKLNPDPTERHGTSELPILMQGPPRRSVVPEIIVLDDDTPPEPSTRAVSPGVAEDAPSPWSCSDELIKLTDYGLLGTPVYELPIEHTPVPHSDNPLNPPKTSVHAYPAVYEPSQLTSDPFVVAPHAWLRDRRATTRESIDTTAEAVEDILGGFDRMDVDESSAKVTGGRLRRSASWELYGIWFSSGSTIASPYSSSAGSSPLSSDAELPTSSESALEAHLDVQSACTVEEPEYAVSPGSGASLDPAAKMEAETACDSPGDNSTTAGRSAASRKNQARVADSTK